MQEHLIEFEGHRIAVVSANEQLGGPCLVFIHGILGSVHFWLPTLPAEIRDGYRWLSISLPGHAPSRFAPGFPTADFTDEFFARLLDGVLQQCVGGRPVHLIGYSTGGFAALNLAIHRPRRVAAVLSICGFARGDWKSGMGWLQWLARRGPLGRSLFKLAMRIFFSSQGMFTFCHRSALARPICHRWKPPGLATLQAVYADAARHDPTELALLFAAIRGFDLRPRLAEITAPVTIAGGDRDPLIPFRHTQNMAAEIPNAHLVTLAGSGHLFFDECLEQFQTRLCDWITGSTGE